MKANVYIDGFNLYYGAVKPTGQRWLDLDRLCQLLLPNDTINRIRYFTALVDERPNDPGQQQRQLTYWRALRTIPHLSIHEGQFRTDVVRRPLANPPPGGPRMADVLKTEEKGSDVNLATYLLVDCFEQDFERAVVISNDSDLLEPIRFVRKKYKRPVVIMSPHPTVQRSLGRVATRAKCIDHSLLAQCLFPPSLTDADGTISKPPGW